MALLLNNMDGLFTNQHLEVNGKSTGQKPWKPGEWNRFQNPQQSMFTKKQAPIGLIGPESNGLPFLLRKQAW